MAAKLLSVWLFAAPWAVPAYHEGVDARGLRLRDVAVHGGRVAADVGLRGEVGHLGWGPGVFVEPGVVEGQDEARALGAGGDGGQQNAGSDGHEQDRRQQPPDVCDAARHLWKHGVIIPERHRERQSRIVDQTSKDGYDLFARVQLQCADSDLGVFKNSVMESLEADAPVE